MTLGLLILIIIGAVLLIWVNIYSFKTINENHMNDDVIPFLTTIVDIILLIIGFAHLLCWAFTIKLW